MVYWYPCNYGTDFILNAILEHFPVELKSPSSYFLVNLVFSYIFLDEFYKSLPFMGTKSEQ